MSICSACGAQFTCGMVDKVSETTSESASGNPAPACWCTALPALLPLPAGGTSASCYCPQCLQQLLQQQALQQ